MTQHGALFGNLFLSHTNALSDPPQGQRAFSGQTHRQVKAALHRMSQDTNLTGVGGFSVCVLISLVE